MHLEMSCSGQVWTRPVSSGGKAGVSSSGPYPSSARSWPCWTHRMVMLSATRTSGQAACPPFSPSATRRLPSPASVSITVVCRPAPPRPGCRLPQEALHGPRPLRRPAFLLAPCTLQSRHQDSVPARPALLPRGERSARDPVLTACLFREFMDPLTSAWTPSPLHGPPSPLQLRVLEPWLLLPAGELLVV